MSTSLAEKLGGWKISWRDMGTVAGLIIMVVVFASMSDVFMTQRNLVNILQQSSINAVIAIGMTLVIISGGIDLSVGPVAALAAVLGATLLVAGVPVPLVILAALGVGAAVWLRERRADCLCGLATLHRHAWNPQSVSGLGADLHGRQPDPQPAQ